MFNKTLALRHSQAPSNSRGWMGYCEGEVNVIADNITSYLDRYKMIKTWDTFKIIKKKY